MAFQLFQEDGQGIEGVVVSTDAQELVEAVDDRDQQPDPGQRRDGVVGQADPEILKLRGECFVQPRQRTALRIDVEEQLPGLAVEVPASLSPDQLLKYTGLPGAGLAGDHDDLRHLCLVLFEKIGQQIRGRGWWCVGIRSGRSGWMWSSSSATGRRCYRIRSACPRRNEDLPAPGLYDHLRHVPEIGHSCTGKKDTVRLGRLAADVYGGATVRGHRERCLAILPAHRPLGGEPPPLTRCGDTARIGEGGQVPFNTSLLLFVVIPGHGSDPQPKLVDSQPFIQQSRIVDGRARISGTHPYQRSGVRVVRRERGRQEIVVVRDDADMCPAA